MKVPILYRVTFASAVVTLVISLSIVMQPTPETVMADFYAAEGRAEDMLMDPLILKSDLVAPTVICEIRNPDMPLRRYAIGFLGNERIVDALPTLHAILDDETELDDVRADALESISRINWLDGRDKAIRFSRTGRLGDVSCGLLDGSPVQSQRTRWQARIGHHE